MSDLHAMMARYAQSGRVDWIGVRPERRADMVPLDAVEVTEDGLEGDHGRPGKRAVTLVQAEHLAAIGAYLGRPPVLPVPLRRNIVIAGLNLAALKDRRIAVGGAILHLSTICAPCSRMEEEFGQGGYVAVRGHGGWCASVVAPGLVRLGDPVRPVD
ncbi:MOSC domain-containing protein [Tateyamaria armeniaca]|uniref:MOSC domain-containing protein n=1 Tax=Tateyamaria armeniaca TaxID=2518930 RepID=A0ABW8UTA0_9RHOB